MSVSKFIMIGRLAKKPELKHTTNGNEYVYFGLAVNKSYKDAKGDKHEKTSWHNIKAYGKIAGICNQYLDKGSQIYVEGEISSSMYEKKGENIYVTDFIASNIQFISTPRNNQNSNNDNKQSNNHPAATNNSNSNDFEQNDFGTDQFNSDDIPF